MSFVVFLKIFKIQVRFEIGFKNCKVIVWGYSETAHFHKSEKMQKKLQTNKDKAQRLGF